jgi:glycosyltransferase involved in cell wall biosynthesis
MKQNKLFLSIVIPCFNEEKTLKDIVVKVINHTKKYRIEILIVDDYSTDNSMKVINDLQKKYKFIRALAHKKNQGKGAALRTGFLNLPDSDITIIQDADLEYDPSEYEKLIEPIIKKNADVVYGSRFLSGSERRVLYFWHRYANGILTLLSNIFTNLNLTDMETCYKVFKSKILKQITIEEDRFGFEPEITAKLSKMNLVIYEVGISYHGRTYEEGKKIGLKDAFRALFCILKYNIFR